MSKNEKLIPQLRFPEFEGMGNWGKNILGNVATFAKGKGIKKSEVTTNGTVLCIRYGELYTLYTEVIDKVVSKTNLASNNLVLSIKNDVIIPSSGETREDIATASCVLKSGVALGGDINIIRTELNGIFLSYFLNGVKKRAIAKLAQGVSIIHLYTSQLKQLEIEIPTPKEQEKIANCLFSLEKLLELEQRELDYLKEHKKGLLQQLIPGEGKTVPKLRFPEFEDCEKWEVKKLSKLGKLISGLTYKPKDVRDKGLLVLRSSNVQNGQIVLEDCVFVRTSIGGANLIAPNDILVCVRNGSKRLIGKNAIIPEGLPLATHGAFMTVFRAKHPEFVNQLFKTETYRRQVKADLGATINSINSKNFLKYEFLVPSYEEQKKIANCLSSIDNLITTQIKQIETLKQQKRGLMQQLFPNINI